MTCYLKTCLTQSLLLLALAAPALVAGCDRDSDAPVNPQVLDTGSGPDVRAADPSDRSSKSTAMSVSDITVTARVKSALLADPEVKGLKIDVDTAGGHVTLEGALATDAQVKRAVEVARTVEGVREVVNRLSVKAEDKAARSTQG